MEQVTAEELILNLTQQFQQTSPDFYFKTVGIAPSPDGQLAAASAEWTNHRGELVGGVVQFTIGPGEDGNPGVVLISHQAPVVARRSASPILFAIGKSFRQAVP